MHVSTAILSLLTFFIAIFAVVLAFQLHALLRTGAIGHTWKIIIVASVVYGIGELLRFGEVWELVEPEVFLAGENATRLVFIALLAWALYVQRQAFFRPNLYRYSQEDGERGYPSRFERVQRAEGFDEQAAPSLIDEELGEETQGSG